MSNSDISEILNEFSSSIEAGLSSISRTGSVKLRGAYGGEGRRQIPSHFLESVTSHASLSEAAGLLSDGTLFEDVVDPLDMEQEIEAQVEKVSTEDESIKVFADYPLDDVAVIDEERNYRTVQPALPTNGLDQSSLLANCIESFTQNYCFVKRNYGFHGAKAVDKLNFAELEKLLPRPVYDGDEEEDISKNSSSDNLPTNLSKSRGSLAASVIDLKSSPADPLLDNLLQFVPQEDVDAMNAKLRSQNRSSNLFGLFSLLQNTSIQDPSNSGFDDPEFPIENLNHPAPPSEHFGHRLLVKCLCLEFEIEIEPIFASIALYDAKAKKKISENFYFDLNSESIRNMVRPKDFQPSLSSLARTAVFSLTYPSQDIFIVIKLEKVLQQGEANTDAYNSDAPEKVLEKAKQNAKWYCNRLGRYRMPFAWTAIHLMNIVNSAKNLQPMEETVTNAQSSEGNSKSSTFEFKHPSLKRKTSLSDTDLAMLSTFKPVTLTVSSFFKQENEKLKDEDLYKFLIDLKRPTNLLKKLKCIPGKLKIDVSPFSSDFPYCMTPDLYRVKPFPDQRGRPSREIQEFASHGVNAPNTTFRNLLFVYPQSVNFANRPGHSRNIAIKIQLLDCEEPCNALPLIYGKSNSPEFVNEAFTTVIYHNKAPDFYEEIKLQLPTKLTTRHHLLFSFYHISCQKKQELTPIETAIGYTWLSLLHNGRLRTGEVGLPVSTEKLPPHYSLHTPETLHPPVKWVDGQRPVFCLQLHLASTVHTLDKHLGKFFSLYEHVEHPTTTGIQPIKLPDGNVIGDLEGELRKSILSLAKDTSMDALVRFLYVVITKITSVLITPPTIDGQSVNMGGECFEGLVIISSRLHNSVDLTCDAHQRNMLLATYVRYMFTVPIFKPPTSPLPTGPTPTFTAASHYATMTRSEKRNRPTMTKATFHISNSNPDLTIPEEATSYDDSVFFRQSPIRSSMSEQPSKHPSDAIAVRSVSHKLFHEEVILLFIVSSTEVKELALPHAWFIFELISKSMAIHLEQNGMLDTPRAQRFSSRYLDDLQRLIRMVSQEIIQRCTKDYDFSERLNCALAFFLNDLLSIMDRGFVFQLIQMYCQMVTNKIRVLLSTSPSSLMVLRITLLRIICSHEHYVTLNLPFIPLAPPSPTPSISSTSSSFTSGTSSAFPSRYDLTESYTRHHFLTGLVLSDVRLCIELADHGHGSMQKVMLFALNTLKQLMTVHDTDPRINQHIQVKRVVASLYVPLLSIAVKALPYAHLFSGQTPTLADDGTVSSSIASAIAGPVTGFDSTFMGEECTRSLLICFLWLLKNTERAKLKSWWAGLTLHHLIGILDLLYICVSCFQFGAQSSIGRDEPTRTSITNRSSRAKDSKSRLQEAILGGSSARQEMLLRRKGDRGATMGGGGGGGREGLRWRKDKTEWKQAKFAERMRQMGEDSLAARNLYSEAMMIVLDTLDVIVETASDLGDPGSSTPQVLSCSLRILLHILSKKQSVEVLQHTFAIQRSIVAKFPEMMFEEETEQCADLSLRLLEKCTSSNTKIRTQSAASLYMLMRHNYSMGNNFAQVKMQVTMSMSTLVGVSHDFDEGHLRRSLKTILSYAEIDSELGGTSFPPQVRDLIFNLHMILSDTVKMKEHQEDPEMLIDLMFRIAKGYQNSPDLRLTWLQNMAKQHSERKNHAEAGMCLLHCAALVSEYLSMVDPSSYLPIGCVAFQEISLNILEESAVSDDVVSPNTDALRSEKYFSLAGFIGLMEQAAHTFSMAGLHEVMAMVYEILSPIYHQQKDYKKLCDVHTKLSESFSKISSQNIHTGWQIGKRMFGTYFRVAFYGALFGDLNGEEFIYKEPAITKLPEISYRLEAFYGQCFGEEKVEVIKDSGEIDRNSLNSSKAYIQITYVDPYFYQYESDMKTTYFERNFGINKFVYATPFTKEGKAHGEMKEQYKRKTFLQVSHTFPYVKTRINVIKRWETILTPLQSACEDVKKKTSDLHKAVNMQPPDVRMLQVNLQGAVLTSVNQGPMEIANTFLVEIPDEPTEWIPYNELRISFKKFIYACSLALKKNRALISTDQKDYHREMERNYNKMAERMKKIDHGRSVMALIRSKHVNGT